MKTSKKNSEQLVIDNFKEIDYLTLYTKLVDLLDQPYQKVSIKSKRKTISTLINKSLTLENAFFHAGKNLLLDIPYRVDMENYSLLYFIFKEGHKALFEESLLDFINYSNILHSFCYRRIQDLSSKNTLPLLQDILTSLPKTQVQYFLNMKKSLSNTTPMHLFSQVNHGSFLEEFKLLLPFEPDLSIKNDQGLTCLNLSEINSPKLYSFLLEYQAHKEKEKIISSVEKQEKNFIKIPL